MTGGERVAVTDTQLAVLGHAAPRSWPATDADLAALPTTDVVLDSPLYAGDLVRADGSATVQYVDAGGTLLTVDPAAMASHGWTAADIAVLPAAAAATPDASVFRRTSIDAPGALPIRNGSLVQTPMHVVGVVSAGTFRRLFDSRMVTAYGYVGKPRLIVPDALIAALPTAPLTSR